MKTLMSSLAIAAISSVQLSPACACTGICIKPEDGSVICARTLEFGMDLESNVNLILRGKLYFGSTPGGQPGLKWTTKYGAVGPNAFGLPVLVDGVNEKGLSVGLFYFPGYAKYQEIHPADTERALAPWELGAFLLGTTANVDEAPRRPKKCALARSSKRTSASSRPAITCCTMRRANARSSNTSRASSSSAIIRWGSLATPANLRLAHYEPAKLREPDRHQCSAGRDVGRQSQRLWPGERAARAAGRFYAPLTLCPRRSHSRNRPSARRTPERECCRHFTS